RGEVGRLRGERVPDARTPGRVVDDHVFDPGRDTGRDREHRQREEANDPPVQLRGQQRGRLRRDDALHRRLVGLRRAGGQLRQQVAHGRRDFVVRLVYHFNVDTHAGQVTPWPGGGRRGARRAGRRATARGGREPAKTRRGRQGLGRPAAY